MQRKVEASNRDPGRRRDDTICTICKGRLGLGHYGLLHWKTTDPKIRRAQVVEHIKKKAEGKRMVKAVGLAKQ